MCEEFLYGGVIREMDAITIFDKLIWQLVSRTAIASCARFSGPYNVVGTRFIASVVPIINAPDLSRPLFLPSMRPFLSSTAVGPQAHIPAPAPQRHTHARAAADRHAQSAPTPRRPKQTLRIASERFTRKPRARNLSRFSGTSYSGP